MPKTVDTLFTNAIVLTMDTEYHIYEPGAVAVDGDSIVDVGPMGEIEAAYTAKETVDVQGQVLVNVLSLKVDAASVDEMRGLADDLRNKLGSGVVILGAVINNKPMLIAAATPDVVKQGVHAGNIVKALAPIIGGGGGGRPNMAQAGGRNASKLDEALNAAPQVVAEQVG